jgi:hypothetical protein
LAASMSVNMNIVKKWDCNIENDFRDILRIFGARNSLVRLRYYGPSTFGLVARL